MLRLREILSLIAVSRLRLRITFPTIPVVGPKGSYGYFGWGKPTGGFCFGVDTSEAKIIRQMEIIDDMSTSSEAYIEVNWGKEGVHWTRNAKTGAFEAIPPYNETQKKGPIGNMFWGKFTNWDTMAQSWGTQIDEWTKYAVDRTFEPESSFTFQVQVPAEISQLQASAQPIWRAWTIDFIVGKKSLDSDWEAYKKAVLDAGMREVTVAANKAWSGLSDTLAKIDAGIK